MPEKRQTTKKPAPKKPAPKKRTSKTQAPPPKEDKSRLYSIILFAVSLFSLALILVPGENVWLFFHNIFLGIFGSLAFLIPIMLGYIAYMIAKNSFDKKTKLRIAMALGVFVVSSSTIYLFTTKAFSEGENFISVLGTYFNLAQTEFSAGFIGAFFGGLLQFAFGLDAARVAIVIILFVLIILLTGVSLVSLYKAMAKPVKAVNGEIKKVKDKKKNKATKPKEKKEKEPKYDPLYSMDNLEDEENEHLQKLHKAYDKEIEEVPLIKEEPVEEKNEILELLEQKKLEINQPTKNEIRAVGTPITSSTVTPLDSSKESLELTSKLAEDAIRKKEEQEKMEIASNADMALYNKEGAHSYVMPPIYLLEASGRIDTDLQQQELKIIGEKLVETLKSFGVQTKIVDICRGPSVTRYELQPAAGVKVSKITNLADDLALNLAAVGVRIEAPIPNKAAVGIEVPNKNKTTVRMRELIESNAFNNSKSNLTVVLGRDIAGKVTIADLAKMPHMLIAGTTGSGKSVCINSLIVSLIYKSSPDDVRFLMIDPKVVELGIYNGIPHLLVPVVTDPRKAAGALGWAVTEMLSRYKIFADSNVKDLHGYNELAKSNNYVDENGQPMNKMPQIVIIIDELADLMMAAPNEVEDYICRLAQMARAAGMHLLVATQRPTVNVVTGLIKANIPSRIAFAVSSTIDSRTILDATGAEKLLGAGDMLFSPVGAHKPTRIQGCFVNEAEIEKIVDSIKKSRSIEYDEKIIEDIEKNAIAEKSSKEKPDNDDTNSDPMMEEAIKCVIEAGQASTSLLQRRLRLGYARAGRLIDEMEQMGIVGPHEGSKPRQVLMSYAQWLERNMQKPDEEVAVPKIEEIQED